MKLRYSGYSDIIEYSGCILMGSYLIFNLLAGELGLQPSETSSSYARRSPKPASELRVFLKHPFFIPDIYKLGKNGPMFVFCYESEKKKEKGDWSRVVFSADDEGLLHGSGVKSGTTCYICHGPPEKPQEETGYRSATDL